LDSGSSDELVSLHTDLSMDVPVGGLEAELRLTGGTSGFQSGDDAVASLGYTESKLTQVFKGKVDAVARGMSEVRLSANTSAWRLVNERINRLYEKQTAGQIVSDLAQDAGVATAKVEDGISFPSYAIVDSKNSWEHISELARRCGFDAYMTADDELAFRAYASSKARVFEYGVDVIDIRGRDAPSLYSAVRVLGESPSSTKGSDTWHWLTKQEVAGTAGKDKELVMVDPSVRDKDTAGKVAQAVLDAIGRSLDVRIVTPGDPDVQLNDTVRVKGMEDTNLNCDYQVRGVEHSFSKGQGFKTMLRCRSV
jgi:phage protein D